MAKKGKGQTQGGKKHGRRFPWAIVIAALITFGAAVALLVVYGGRFFPPAPLPKERPPALTINLYFSDEEGTRLKAERREIQRGPVTIKDAAVSAIEELIKGPASGPAFAATMPKGTRLLSLKIENAVAYVNFSKEFMRNHPGGSSGELQTIYSVVNTLTLNFPDIKKTQLLIEGETQDTLAGHIVISIPLGPDRKMIKD
ncbi:MAG: GerMN domain-containing protein [Deltaproteobacteria bacterium]|nr:GerMN domain-containing protein [Deltaproteobacteria bacterium]